MARRRNPFVRFTISFGIRAFLWVSRRIPLPVLRALTVPAGRAIAWCVPRVRRVTLANLDRAYGDSLTRQEKLQILRGAVDNLAIVAADFAHLDRLAAGDSPYPVSIEGAEFIERGQGYLFVGAHLGNWEFMAPLMTAKCGYPVAEVVRPFDDPSVDRAIDGIRQAAKVHTIPKDNAGREITRLLKEGYLVGILVDQSPRDNGVPVTFFGEPCWATVGPVMIAVRAKVPILPASLVRRPDQGYVLRIYPPITMERSGNLRADLVRNSQKCQDAIEAMVRETPDQWLWLHRRWKDRPRLAAEWKEREARDR